MRAWALAIIAVTVALLAVTNLRQEARLNQLELDRDHLQHQVIQQQIQIVQLNRKVFGVPSITCTNCLEATP